MVGSGDAARSRAGVRERTGFDGSTGGGLEFFCAIDSRRGLVDAVEEACAEVCSGAGTLTVGDDLLGSMGDG